jgi:hypothetical protein
MVGKVVRTVEWEITREAARAMVTAAAKAMTTENRFLLRTVTGAPRNGRNPAL